MRITTITTIKAMIIQVSVLMPPMGSAGVGVGVGVGSVDPTGTKIA